MGVTLTIAPTGWPMGVAQMGQRGRWDCADVSHEAPICAATSAWLIALLLSAPAGGKRQLGRLSGAAGWGSGSAARLAHTRRPVRRVRAARLPAHARGMPAPAAASAPAPPGWRTRGAPCAGSPPPLELCKLCPGAACCKERKPTPLQGSKAALLCGGAFVERYRGWLGLRRPHCISY